MIFILFLIIIILATVHGGAPAELTYSLSTIIKDNIIYKIFKDEYNNKLWEEKIYRKYISIRNLKTSRKFLYMVDGKPTPVYIVANDTINQQILTDFFVDKIRMQCKNIYFDKPAIIAQKPKTLEEYIEYRGRLFDFKNMNQRQCFLYPINIARYIFDKYKPESVLDMSMGWGDRLIASLLQDCKIYYGTDPNIDLNNCYNKIYNTFAKNDTVKKYKFMTKPFEDILSTDLDGIKFDLMFSCPPYFNTEQYSKHKGQSYLRYKKIDLWIKKFMFKSIDIIYNNLKDGGYFVMQLSDNREEKFTEKVLDYIDKKFLYLGCIVANFFVIQHQPIWIWRKLPPHHTPELYYKELYDIVPATVKSIDYLYNLIERAYKNPTGRGWTDEKKYGQERISKLKLSQYITYFDVFTYFLDSRLVGCICVMKPQGNTVEFGLIAVDPDYQKQGIGGKLLDFAEQFAYDYLNVIYIILYVYKDRDNIIKWYNKKGYSTIKTEFNMWILQKKLN